MSENTYTETTKIALYGRYGSGKTRAVGDLIGAGHKVVVVSAEHGLGTIRSLLTSENVIEVTDLPSLRKAHVRCVEAHNDPSWWVCIDGGSQIVEWIANQQFTGADTYFGLKARGETIPDSLKEYGRYISDRADAIDGQRIYGRIGRDSENLWAAWIRGKWNLYANFLEDMTGTNSRREKIEPWGPDVPGKVGLKAVMSSFDYVGRLEYDAEGRTTGYFDPASRSYMARTREDRRAGVVIPGEIPNFNLAAFVNLIRGGGGE